MTQDGTTITVDSQNKDNDNQNHKNAKSISSNQEYPACPSNILDFPIENHDDDRIGMEDILDGMVDYINHAQMPFTIAVQGEWGMGKTSFLYLLKDRLCEKDSEESPTKETTQSQNLFQNQGKNDRQNNCRHLYYSVWIDACDFALLQSPISAVINMLQSMVYQISKLKPVLDEDQKMYKHLKKIKSATKSTMKNMVKLVAKNVITSSAKVATAGIINEKMIDDLAAVITDSWSNTNNKQNSQDSNLSAIKQLHKDITHLIECVLDQKYQDNYLFTQNIKDINKNPKKRGIVFFIDNLDRIDPTLAVEILEVTKNIFNFSNSVFIVALDNNIALRGLQAKLGTLSENNEQIFRAYFDKFVQQSISLPPQSSTTVLLLFKLLTDVNYFSEFELTSPKNHLIKINFIKRHSVTTLREVLSDFALFSFDSSNPRLIKRFVNTLSLLLRIRQAKNNNFGFLTTPVDTITKALMFIIVCIQYSFLDIYKTIISPDFTCRLLPEYIYTKKSVLDHLENKLYQTFNIDKADMTNFNSRTYQSILRVILALRAIEHMTKSTHEFNEKLVEAIETAILSEQKPVFSKTGLKSHWR